MDRRAETMRSSWLRVRLASEKKREKKGFGSGKIDTTRLDGESRGSRTARRTVQHRLRKETDAGVSKTADLTARNTGDNFRSRGFVFVLEDLVSSY